MVNFMFNRKKKSSKKCIKDKSNYFPNPSVRKNSENLKKKKTQR